MLLYLEKISMIKIIKFIVSTFYLLSFILCERVMQRAPIPECLQWLGAWSSFPVLVAGTQLPQPSLTALSGAAGP